MRPLIGKLYYAPGSPIYGAGAEILRVVSERTMNEPGDPYYEYEYDMLMGPVDTGTAFDTLSDFYTRLVPCTKLMLMLFDIKK